MSKSKLKPFTYVTDTRPWGCYDAPEQPTTVITRVIEQGVRVQHDFGVTDAKGRRWGAYSIISLCQHDVVPSLPYRDKAGLAQQTAGGWRRTRIDPACLPPHSDKHFEVYAHITRDEHPYGASPGTERFATEEEALAYVGRRVKQAKARYEKRASKAA